MTEVAPRLPTKWSCSWINSPIIPTAAATTRCPLPLGPLRLLPPPPLLPPAWQFRKTISRRRPPPRHRRQTRKKTMMTPTASSSRATMTMTMHRRRPNCKGSEEVLGVFAVEVCPPSPKEEAASPVGPPKEKTKRDYPEKRKMKRRRKRSIPRWKERKAKKETKSTERKEKNWRSASTMTTKMKKISREEAEKKRKKILGLVLREKRSHWTTMKRKWMRKKRGITRMRRSRLRVAELRNPRILADVLAKILTTSSSSRTTTSIPLLLLLPSVRREWPAPEAAIIPLPPPRLPTPRCRRSS